MWRPKAAPCCTMTPTNPFRYQTLGPCMIRAARDSHQYTFHGHLTTRSLPHYEYSGSDRPLYMTSASRKLLYIPAGRCFRPHSRARSRNVFQTWLQYSSSMATRDESGCKGNPADRRAPSGTVNSRSEISRTYHPLSCHSSAIEIRKQQRWSI